MACPAALTVLVAAREDEGGNTACETGRVFGPPKTNSPVVKSTGTVVAVGAEGPCEEKARGITLEEEAKDPYTVFAGMVEEGPGPQEPWAIV